MFITKKHISRRTMLRGMGAIVALPFLESMVPAQTPTQKTAAISRSRLACVEMVHGSAGSTEYGTKKNLWAPSATGRDFEFTPLLKSLERFRDYTTIVSHTDCNAADAISNEEVGGDHYRCSSIFLTASHAKQTEGSDIFCGTSLDQMYAQKFGQDTPLPSIQLSIDNMDTSATCGYHYSCAYMETISWSSPSTPLPMTRDPRLAFEELFGAGGSAEDRAERLRTNRSILDRINHAVARIKQDLDPKDRTRLADYLDNIREIERRIQGVEAYNAAHSGERQLPSAPMGVPDSWEDHVKLMFDLQVLAFAAEITRVSAYKLSHDTTNRVFPESGTSTPFHTASHHQQRPDMIEDFAKINRYHVDVFSYFIEKLKNTPDGDGSLLDHSLVLYGSPMGDSHVHGHKRVPLLLLGSVNGRLKGNLHVRAKDDTPQANALLTIGELLGLNIESFGNSVEPLSI